MKNDGGPAFPLVENDGRGGEFVAVGMSLRDYLAGQALQGLWSAMADGDAFVALMTQADKAGITAEELMANRAYKQADAMLKEREK